MPIQKQKIFACGIKFFIQKNGEEVARGYLYLLKNDLHKKPFGLMEDIYVAEKMRAKGLGTEIVGAIIKEAKKQGCYKLIGTSRASRPKVHALYERLGFKNWGAEFRVDF